MCITIHSHWQQVSKHLCIISMGKLSIVERRHSTRKTRTRLNSKGPSYIIIRKERHGGSRPQVRLGTSSNRRKVLSSRMRRTPTWCKTKRTQFQTRVRALWKSRLRLTQSHNHSKKLQNKDRTRQSLSLTPKRMCRLTTDDNHWQRTIYRFRPRSARQARTASTKKVTVPTIKARSPWSSISLYTRSIICPWSRHRRGVGRKLCLGAIGHARQGQTRARVRTVRSKFRRKWNSSSSLLCMSPHRRAMLKWRQVSWELPCRVNRVGRWTSQRKAMWFQRPRACLTLTTIQRPTQTRVTD